ncbi:MAG: transcriptional regulator, partial [Neglectibacter timonensis]
MTSEFTIAVHALVYLNHKAQLLSSEALAKNICTNP